MSLNGLRRVAACTPGDATAAMALGAAEDLLGVAKHAQEKDKQLVKAAFEHAHQEHIHTPEEHTFGGGMAQAADE